MNRRYWMNYFLTQSIELANQRDYLDQLLEFILCRHIREIDSIKWQRFEQAFAENKQMKS